MSLIQTLVREAKAETEARKNRALSRSEGAQKLESLLAEIQREQAAVTRESAALGTQWGMTQRDQQAASRDLTKRIEGLQAKLADARTLEAQLALADIDDLLHETLLRDDNVDFSSLRRTASRPQFTSKFTTPIAKPGPLPRPQKPQMESPPEPSGVARLFGGKAKHEAKLMSAQTAHEEAVREWERRLAKIDEEDREAAEKHQRREDQRLASLAGEKAKHEKAQKDAREAVRRHNDEVEAFRRRYEARDEAAICDYLKLVFARSLYPANMSLGISYEYQAAEKELRLSVVYPRPEDLPSVKGYKYVKARGEVQEVHVTPKESRDRYLGLIQNLALRLMHEAWESDRMGHVETISLSGGVDHVDPATGRDTHTQLIAVAVDRQTFAKIDLRRATPSEALKFLHAVVSKDPSTYKPAVDGYGVRGG